MSDFLQELDDAVRREKAEKFWKDNGAYLIGGAALLVLMTGVFTAWTSWQTKRNSAQTDILISALSTGFASTALDAASGALEGNHLVIARLQQAAALAGEGKKAEAVAALEKLSSGSGGDPALRDLATLTLVRLSFDPAKDKASASALLGKLKPLLAESSPWRAEALIETALITAEGLEDYNGAVRHVSAVLEIKDIPDGLRERAQSLRHVYIVKSSDNKAAAEAEPRG